MSEFHVQAVKLEKFGKHPNADQLSIISIEGRPVIFRTEDFAPGSMAIHVPTDALVDTSRKEFDWLAGTKVPGGTHRVKFKKLRGIPSYGFLIPAPEGALPGQNFQDSLGIVKYEPEIAPGHQGSMANGGPHLPYYDLESVHKHRDAFAGLQVVVTEKIHGQQGKWTVKDGEVLASSRNHYRRDSVWNRMAEKYELSRIPEGYALYGEVYGPGCQDLTYGVTEPCVAFFDVMELETGLYLDIARFREFTAKYNLPTPAVLYEGMFDSDKMYKLAEGCSVQHMDNYDAAHPGLTGMFHVREGIVVKPVIETYTVDIGRLSLKLVGEGYLTRKGG